MHQLGCAYRRRAGGAAAWAPPSGEIVRGRRAELAMDPAHHPDPVVHALVMDETVVIRASMDLVDAA